jgi:hypothetical protein
MRNPPPAHDNHFHFTRQYGTDKYVVFDSVINRYGDTFRIWIPKNLNVSKDQIFPAFCAKTRGDRIYEAHTGMSAARVRAATKKRKPKPKTKRKNARSRN